MQQSLFDNNDAPQLLPDLPGAHVCYYPNWLQASAASALYASLCRNVNWRQDTIKLFGKPVKIPRLQAWFGDSTTTYSYSGLTMIPTPWTAELAEIKQRCEKTAQTRFNSVLVNWYRDGQDSMGMHADDEPELGPQPIIASVTLGQARPFLFRHKKTKVTTRVLLEPGSLLIMSKDTQRYYHHGINKTKKPLGGRINLTFRYVYPAMPELP